jgi:hypothetical protein
MPWADRTGLPSLSRYTESNRPSSTAMILLRSRVEPGGGGSKSPIRSSTKVHQFLKLRIFGEPNENLARRFAHSPSDIASRFARRYAQGMRPHFGSAGSMSCTRRGSTTSALTVTCLPAYRAGSASNWQMDKTLMSSDCPKAQVASATISGAARLLLHIRPSAI